VHERHRAAAVDGADEEGVLDGVLAAGGELLVAEAIDLVVDEEARDLAGAELAEDPVDGGHVLLAVGVAGVDDQEEEVGPRDLLEGGGEGLHERGREVADEADGVEEDDLAVLREADPADGRVEGGEELVLGDHLALGDRVEEGALAGVGVADDRDHRDAARVAEGASLLALLAEVLQALLEVVDPVLGLAAVELELGLAGAAAADPAGEARHHGAVADHEGHAVAELGELDL